MTLILPAPLQRLLTRVPALEHAYLVGGCVRDALLGEPVVDFDVEVYGLDYPSLARALSRHGRVDWVGRAFGILKLRVPSGEVYDFSLPRRDSKTGPGHQGFEVTFDPHLDPAEASSRRDFTINSLLWDPRRNVLLDFHGGEADLRERRLRHTSPAFVEDPLRVLRGMQFAGRFDLVAARETLELCRSISGTYGEIAVERIREEWMKWGTRSRRPSAGLKFLHQCGWLIHYPELQGLVGVPQDPEWHPEGDVWIHTLHVMDALVSDPGWDRMPSPRRWVFALAALLHDVGKQVSTVREERRGQWRWVSPGHETSGLPLATSFMGRLAVPAAVQEQVLPLIAEHMVRLQNPSDRALRRLAHRLKPVSIQDLAVILTADASGRPPRPAGQPGEVRQLLEQATRMDLSASAPQPILQGRHLLAFGMKAGPDIGRLLGEAFEAQLDGAFADLDGALRWVREREG